MIVFSFNFFNAGNYLLSGGSFLISALFIYFMIQNIRRIKKIKEGSR